LNNSLRLFINFSSLSSFFNLNSDLSTCSSSGTNSSYSSTENSDDNYSAPDDQELQYKNKSRRDPNHDRDDEETFASNDVLAKIYSQHNKGATGNRMYTSYANKVPAARYTGKREKDVEKSVYVPPLPYAQQSTAQLHVETMESLYVRLPKKSLSSINLNNHHHSSNSNMQQLNLEEVDSFFPVRPTIQAFGGSQELLPYKKTTDQNTHKSLKVSATPQASHDTDFYNNLHRWTASSSSSSKPAHHKSSMPNFLNVVRILRKCIGILIIVFCLFFFPQLHDMDKADENQDKHVVIDIVPRMMPNTQQKQPPIQRILDQTIGIPLVPAFSSNNQLSYTPLTHSLSGSMPNFATKNFKNHFADTEPPPPPPKYIHQYPLISANIPPKTRMDGGPSNQRGPNDYLPSAMASSSGPKQGGLAKKSEVKNSILSNNNSGSSENILKKENSEKQKVKFSDTITVAVVPEIPRKERMFITNEHHRRSHQMFADPKKELAESLPLCHPHDDYLKDFMPIQGKH
jgi:hypothetical protein